MTDYTGGAPQRALDDGRSIVLYNQIFTWRLCIGPTGAQWLDDFWCYEHADYEDAVVALLTWDATGDPPGRWIRNGSSGRRRAYDDDGNLVREWVHE